VAVDRAAGTITILHKPIPTAFMMETMTMIFRVADKSILHGLSAGDKIRFEVQREGRGYVVVRIENSN
jgi:Cu/Ag efflux protein CusF